MAPRLIADRYEVIRVLGEGSSARTLLCSDLREDRRVAVKELHFAHLDDWKHLELFEREAKMLSMLEHPGIPRIFDYFRGPGASATFYIVQEFVDGRSLLQRMESGPVLGQKEVYELALGLLDVLEYLHGRAPPIIHRDIKPSNLILRPDGAPALVDFGGACIGQAVHLTTSLAETRICEKQGLYRTFLGDAPLPVAGQMELRNSG